MTMVLRNTPHFAEITLAGPVESANIYPLCDNIDHAITHFYYENVKLRISSPGGETVALRYYLSQLEQWHRSGIKIETIALTECSSAAAVMLTMGTRGHRHADNRHARLLWHFARIPSDMILKREASRHAGGLTARAGAAVVKQLGDLQAVITRDDDYIIETMMRHITGGDPNKPDNWFSEEYLRRKYFIQAQMDDAIKQASGMACHWSDRDEMKVRWIADSVYRDAMSPEEAATFLEVEMRGMLDEDRCCSPLEAWTLFLIDDFGGSKND